VTFPVGLKGTRQSRVSRDFQVFGVQGWGGNLPWGSEGGTSAHCSHGWDTFAIICRSGWRRRLGEGARRVQGAGDVERKLSSLPPGVAGRELVKTEPVGQWFATG
jgi:hypothetical protein